jgi:hypothetical protein
MILREPEIELKRSGSSADLSGRVGDNRRTMGEPIGRVVVIEDEQPVRDAVLAALRAEGFTATAFEDLPRPGDVLALAPDLAILDVLLPSGNGFEWAGCSGSSVSCRSFFSQPATPSATGSPDSNWAPTSTS